GGAIKVRSDEHHGAQADHRLAEGEDRMRQAYDLDVKAVGIVPPVVEGRRREHRDSAPRRDKASERPAKPPYGNRAVAKRAGIVEGGAEDRVAARHAGEDSRHVDHHVRGGPEGVASNRDMPGDVPVSAERIEGRRRRKTPYEPRDGGGARGGRGTADWL